MVLLIIIPFLNGYFIGNINPTFSDKPKLGFQFQLQHGRLVSCLHCEQDNVILGTNLDGRPSGEAAAPWFQGDLTIKNGDLIWVNYNDLTTTSLEIMVSKGNHPQMALIQISELL